AGVVLWYSVSAGPWQSVAMTPKAGGAYEGTVPGQAGAAPRQFYVEGTDSLGAKSTFPATGRGSRALYRVSDGAAVLGRVHNVRIVMTQADTTLLHTVTNVMSNDRLGCTSVYAERQAFYDAAVAL